MIFPHNFYSCWPDLHLSTSLHLLLQLNHSVPTTITPFSHHNLFPFPINICPCSSGLLYFFMALAQQTTILKVLIIGHVSKLHPE